jgi:hypothetical protein
VGKAVNGSFSVKLLAGGTCALIASPGGSLSYFPALPLRLSFDVLSPATYIHNLMANPLTPTYGHEASAVLSASVYSDLGVTSGTLTFKVGKTVLCAATVTNGAGSCTITKDTLLKAGTYAAVASYAKTDPSSALKPSSTAWALTIR